MPLSTQSTLPISPCTSHEPTDHTHTHTCLLLSHSLAGVNLTDESCETLASILQCANSHLVELDLSFNSVGDLGVKLLCIALSNPHSRLEKLTLSHNQLEQIGVKLLCDCLKSPHCKLHSLGSGVASLGFHIITGVFYIQSHRVLNLT